MKHALRMWGAAKKLQHLERQVGIASEKQIIAECKERFDNVIAQCDEAIGTKHAESCFGTQNEHTELIGGLGTDAYVEAQNRISREFELMAGCVRRRSWWKDIRFLGAAELRDCDFGWNDDFMRDLGLVGRRTRRS